PEKYRDEYRDAVMEMIETKAKNKTLPAAPAATPRSTNVVDLVKVLQESINRSQSGRVKRGGNGASGRQRSAPTLVKQKRRAAAGLFSFDGCLDAWDHGHGGHEHDAGNDLMGPQCRVKEPPRSTIRGERLHHFKITGRGSGSETKSFEINK